MKLNCLHWTDCGVIGGGCCAKGVYVKPSIGVCERACRQREPIPNYSASLLSPTTLVKGVKGLAKAALHIDRAPQNVIDQRLATCGACDQHNAIGQCKLCKCIVSAKVMIAGESCPVGKWAKVERAKSAKCMTC